MFNWLSNFDINDLRFRGNPAQDEDDVCNQAKEANSLRETLDRISAGRIDGTLQVKRIDESSSVPTRGSPGSAGLDLYSAWERTISAGSYARIPAGVEIAIPSGYVGLIWPRSGIAAEFGIDVLAGVIDSDYRGEVVVILANHGSRAFAVQPGDRIAQLIVQPVARLQPREVPELPDTFRGNGGFGSTGR